MCINKENVSVTTITSVTLVTERLCNGSLDISSIADVMGNAIQQHCIISAVSQPIRQKRGPASLAQGWKLQSDGINKVSRLDRGYYWQ